MPAVLEISATANSYSTSANILEKSFAGVSEEEWLRRPNENSNALHWVVGHIIECRATALRLIGVEWSRPWLPLYARGAELKNDNEYPSQAEVLAAWSDVKAELNAALENASPEALDAPASVGIPSTDGKISGVLAFLTFHETYHVGQACYLHKWLGHGRILG